MLPFSTKRGLNVAFMFKSWMRETSCGDLYDVKLEFHLFDSVLFAMWHFFLIGASVD